jgi:hypothetical protein
MPGQGDVTLVCPPGAEGGAISHGGQSFEAWHDHRLNRWLVRVPFEVAHHFCWNAGFYRAPAEYQDSGPGA